MTAVLCCSFMFQWGSGPCERFPVPMQRDFVDLARSRKSKWAVDGARSLRLGGLSKNVLRNGLQKLCGSIPTTVNWGTFVIYCTFWVCYLPKIVVPHKWQRSFLPGLSHHWIQRPSTTFETRFEGGNAKALGESAAHRWSLRRDWGGSRHMMERHLLSFGKSCAVYTRVSSLRAAEQCHTGPSAQHLQVELQPMANWNLKVLCNIYPWTGWGMVMVDLWKEQRLAGCISEQMTFKSWTAGDGRNDRMTIRWWRYKQIHKWKNINKYVKHTKSIFWSCNDHSFEVEKIQVWKLQNVFCSGCLTRCHVLTPRKVRRWTLPAFNTLVVDHQCIRSKASRASKASTVFFEAFSHYEHMMSCGVSVMSSSCLSSSSSCSHKSSLWQVCKHQHSDNMGLFSTGKLHPVKHQHCQGLFWPRVRHHQSKDAGDLARDGGRPSSQVESARWGFKDQLFYDDISRCVFGGKIMKDLGTLGWSMMGCVCRSCHEAMVFFLVSRKLRPGMGLRSVNDLEDAGHLADLAFTGQQLQYWGDIHTRPTVFHDM